LRAALPHFPRLSAYLDLVPDGLASYPDCQAKGSVLRHVAEQGRLREAPAGALPARLHGAIVAPALDGEWVPEVALVATVLAAADHLGLDDDAFLAWIGPVNRALFSAIHGLVLSVLTPEFAARNAASYWKMFHRGTTLAPERVGDRHWLLHLRYPGALFWGVALRQYAPVIEVGFRFAEPSTRIVLREEAPGHAAFEVTWGR
jgi:hypothetical protein